ncbi:hypothetical protein E5Q11_08140 [Marinobacter confluentis]|uniref:7TM-DISM receptor extracellular domain-containing protein n=1 Tax=Marinobacter confluentis TaxID=1697557 RepID=A0A4Z1C9C1_9GAMM|nr:hypothetical protein E5Q11_08140 [Marinobacter confluentis]
MPSCFLAVGYAHSLATVVITIWLALALISGTLAWRRGYRPARYFVFAFVALIIPGALILPAKEREPELHEAISGIETPASAGVNLLTSGRLASGVSARRSGLRSLSFQRSPGRLRRSPAGYPPGPFLPVTARGLPGCTCLDSPLQTQPLLHRQEAPAWSGHP